MSPPSSGGTSGGTVLVGAVGVRGVAGARAVRTPAVFHPAPGVVTLAVEDAICNAATLLDDTREVTGKNDGRAVNHIQATTGNGTGDPWCASTVAHVGARVLGRAWPLPLTASCDVLLEFARERGWLVTDPRDFRRGDVFLRLKHDRDADHAGFVFANLGGGQFATGEGNTSNSKTREGDGWYDLVRGGPGDRHRYVAIRWTRAFTAA